MRSGLLAILFVLSASLASAQAVTVNPTKIESFLASPDHASMVGTVPMVDHYEFVVVQQNNPSSVAFTFPLGKPTPAAPVPPATEGIIGPIVVPNLLTMAPGINYIGFVDTVPTASLGLQASRSLATAPFVRVTDPRAAGKPVLSK